MDIPNALTRTPPPHRVWLRRAAWIAATAAIVATMALWPGRTRIAPLIIADNAYIFLAADRMYDGLGPTSMFPHAPLQAWTWRTDWALLTQWPVGYPALLCAARWLLGVTTARAAVAIGIVCCGVAVVAWFAWLRRCLPDRFPSGPIAAVGAMSTFSVHNLVNPSTDAILLAAMPLVLLLTHHTLYGSRHRQRGAGGDDLGGGDPVWGDVRHGGWTRRAGWRIGQRGRRPDERSGVSGNAPSRRRCDGQSAASGDGSCGGPVAVWRVVLVGLVAGSLVWIRYAAIFLPAAIGLFLLFAWLVTGRSRCRHVAAYAAGAALPIVSLVVVNLSFGAGESAQQQFNLGERMSFDFRIETVATAWDLFTKQTIYAHVSWSQWFFAWVVPLGGLAVPVLLPGTRRHVQAYWSRPAMLLSVTATVTLLGTLIAVTTLFREKFNYVAIERYYWCARPFYWVFFIGPVLTFASRLPRVVMCVPLLMIGSWYVRQDWTRTYRRWLRAERVFTDYGRWAYRFHPNATELYRWLRAQRGDDLVVFSNFHDDIGLETWIPACPTPADRDTMETWLARIRLARGVAHVRVLFVLDPSNNTRDYFLPPPDAVIATFNLKHVPDAPAAIARYVYAPALPEHAAGVAGR